LWTLSQRVPVFPSTALLAVLPPSVDKAVAGLLNAILVEPHETAVWLAVAVAVCVAVDVCARVRVTVGDKVAVAVSVSVNSRVGVDVPVPVPVAV
jgi:hypothetical protein